ncbi:hypothetical protein SEA_FLAPPER_88 [Gordonia phage Flapper]|uniref:Uncharacterized protein n=1 Tax=Gordonia phage Flapper TaxID=2079415 RepID=A0A2L1IXB9_9CAUD|nr:hypothetical protein KNT82_gp88 [Gordonia phage Flapper]AVD99831.1 hypothetical protein SEA_FLAPPER_88 [Gordonia phage Flapper]
MFDRIAANLETIARVQADAGLTAKERNVAGPAVMDAREASRNGWTITHLSPYALAVVDADGDTLTAEYIRATNGVLTAHMTIGGRRRQIAHKRDYSLREQVRSIIAAR